MGSNGPFKDANRDAPPALRKTTTQVVRISLKYVRLSLVGRRPRPQGLSIDPFGFLRFAPFGLPTPSVCLCSRSWLSLLMTRHPVVGLRQQSRDLLGPADGGDRRTDETENGAVAGRNCGRSCLKRDAIGDGLEGGATGRGRIRATNLRTRATRAAKVGVAISSPMAFSTFAGFSN